MKERTFYPDIFKIERNGEEREHIRTHSDYYEFRKTHSVRNAYCRGCGRVIPKGVIKVQRRVVHTYGRLGNKLTDFSYCLKCMPKVMEAEIKECKKFISNTRKLKRKIKQKHIDDCEEKIKEVELVMSI